MEEILRLIYNIVRVGTIFAVDYSAVIPRVRVRTGDIETNWLPWLEYRASSTKTWDPLTIGEQVLIFSPNGDTSSAIALGSLNSDNNPPPSRSESEHKVLYPDGATFTYDHASSKLSISGISSIDLNIGLEMNINCPNIYFNGSLIQEGGEIKSNGIVVDKHLHGGVSSGGSNTEGPV